MEMVIEDGRNKIALECDGERLYTKSEMSKDLRRQAVLERLGWKFIRVRGSKYYKDPEGTMNWIYSILSEQGIKPNDENEHDIKRDYSEELLIDIKQRAKAIRREWGFEKNEDYEETKTIDLEYNYMK